MIIPIRFLIICKNTLEIKSLIDLLRNERYNPFIQIVDKKGDVVFLLDNYQWDILIIDYGSLNDYYGKTETQISWVNQIQKRNPFTSILIAFGSLKGNLLENFVAKIKFKYFIWDKLDSVLPYIKIETILLNLKKQQFHKKKFYLYENENNDNQEENFNNRSIMDNYDRSIIKYLFQNGRSTLNSIAQSIKSEKNKKISHVFVKRRIDRLLKNDIIKIQSNVNLEKFDYYLTTFLVQTENKEVCEKILKIQSKCPRILISMEVYGKYDLILIYIAINLDRLESTIHFCNPEHFKGVQNVELLVSTKITLPKYFPIPFNFENKCEIASCNLSTKDWKSTIN